MSAKFYKTGNRENMNFTLKTAILNTEWVWFIHYLKPIYKIYEYF